MRSIELFQHVIKIALFTGSRHIGVHVAMVICAVYGCSSRSGRDKLISFYRIPAVSFHKGQQDYELRKKRRAGFLAAISRRDVEAESLNNWRVCSRHFVSGKPADLYDITNPDWLPTLNLGHDKECCIEQLQLCTNRYKRAEERELKRKYLQEMLQEVPFIVVQLIEMVTEEEIKTIATEQIDIGRQYIEVNSTTEKPLCNRACEYEALQEQLSRARHTIETLTQELREHPPPFCEEQFVSDDFTKFHTGLPNFKILKCIYDHVSNGMSQEKGMKLSLFQEYVCVLLKLRTNAANEDLAYRFSVSCATISRIIRKWLPQMDRRMDSLIFWPERDALQKTMPQSFQQSFGKKVAVIIDCFEIFIERPSNLKARASTWSNYKHHNTVKVLLGITPQGVICFVSECWGGRVSDVRLTEDCGILKKLLPGDLVLADRGFDIGDSVAAMQAKLHIPSFTRGKSQLSATEVEETRKIANVRIHVERVIGCVRQKYKILQSTLPIQFVTTQKDADVPLIDHIVRVCCELNNVCDSVVPFE